MDISTILLPTMPFIVGYLIERNYAPLRIKANRKNWGQRSQEMIMWGVLTLTISFVVSRLIYKVLVQDLGLLEERLEQFKNIMPSQYSGTFVLMILLILVFVWILRLMDSSTSAIGRLYIEHGDPFERMLFSSVTQKVPIILTYKNGWVYVVYMTELPEVGRNELYLNVVVLLSGYKDDTAVVNISDFQVDELLNKESIDSSIITTAELQSVAVFENSYNKAFKSDS